MKLIGVCLISLTPIILGAKKYINLINRLFAFKEFLNVSYWLLDEIKYQTKELHRILEKENSDFFILNDQVRLNTKRLAAMGLNTTEITVLEEFLNALQNGDRDYVLSQGEICLKKIEGLKNSAEKQLSEKGRVYITAFLGISAMIFLVLI